MTPELYERIVEAAKQPLCGLYAHPHKNGWSLRWKSGLGTGAHESGELYSTHDFAAFCDVLRTAMKVFRSHRVARTMKKRAA